MSKTSNQPAESASIPAFSEGLLHGQKLVKPSKSRRKPGEHPSSNPTPDQPGNRKPSRDDDIPEIKKGSKYQQIREIARRQKKKERQKRLETEEVLSSDEEDGDKVGLGLQLLDYMKKDTNEEELISQFQEAVSSKFDETELGPKFEAPDMGSTVGAWKVEDDLQREMALAQEKRSQLFLEKRSSAMKRSQGKTRELNLSNLGLDDVTTTACAEQLSGNTTLEALILSINNIGELGATSVSEVLRFHPKIATLTISRNRIGTEGLKALASALQSCPSLTELRADYNEIGPELPHEIEQLHGLKTLGLRGNSLQRVPLQLLRSVEHMDIEENAPELFDFLDSSLKLVEGVAIKRLNSREAAAHLKQGWSFWKDLDMPKATLALDAARRKLEEPGDETADLIDQVAELEEAIRARREALGPGFIRAKNPESVMVGASIEGAMRKIEQGAPLVSLFGQRVGNVGSTSLAKALRKNDSLTWLDLECCNIGPPGVRELAEALDGNTKLETLILARNDIGDAGSRALAHALESNTTLVKLDLSWNKIGAEGSAAIARSVMANPSLRELCMRLNNVHDHGATQVAMALKSLRGLQELDLAGCGIGPTGSAVITRELQFHSGLLHGKLWR